MYIQKSKQKLLFTSNARLRVDWLRWTSNEVTFSQKAFSSSPMPGESLQCSLHCVTWPFFALAFLLSILDAFSLH
eukprot:m.256635 g.256635  ORF g.256635 m.256635 type:complete len:75 (+) comp40401_c0_seq32:145-369(+)